MKETKGSHQHSIDNPKEFWQHQLSAIDWFKKPDSIVSQDDIGMGRWFEGGVLNTCYNALDRHVNSGRGSQTALIYDSPVTKTQRSYSYSELLEEVSLLAGAIQNQGVSRGDRVIIYMPMIPQAVMAMLACARIGAIHSVVFGGFAAKELAKRIDDAQPKLIFSASCGIEVQRVIPYKPLLDEAQKIASHPADSCMIWQRKECLADLQNSSDLDWQEALKSAQPTDCAELESTDPLYILYTSGTTGQPKGIVRDNGGHAIAMSWSMKNIYDIQPGEVFWAASDVGWVVGHSYIVYGPLINGSTTILYEGKPVGTPDAGAFWRVIDQYDVKALFTAPTAIRAIRKEDPNAECVSDYQMSKLKYLFLAGERCDPDTLNWAKKELNIPVIDHWWQTETGWSIAANCMGLNPLPVKPGSPTKAVPGYQVQVLDEDGNSSPPGTMGAIAIRLPLPPGTLKTLWNNKQRLIDSYLSTYKGYYLSGDAGYIDEDGYIFIMSRTDDVINVAGHRLSTGAMEEVISSHPAIAECAVMGVHCPLKGQVPMGLVVLKDGVLINDQQLSHELIQMIRDQIGAVASFKQVAQVQRLPKTRSGKILRGIIRTMADGKDYTTPATIDDPKILDEITLVLNEMGYQVKNQQENTG